jgi:predicted nucleotidyltransferase
MNLPVSGRILRRLILARRRKLLRLAKQLDVQSIWLVGSVARGEATRISDIDFYIDSDDPLTLHLLRGWLTCFGRSVDIIHPGTLIDRGDKFAANVLNDAIPLHKGGPGSKKPLFTTNKD